MVIAELVHLASLAAGFLLLLFVGRGQWFITDDWEFIARRGLFGAEFGLFHPHNEHWSTAPVLIYRALFNLFGVRTYLPYLAVVLLLHVAVSHILWRIMRTAGVAPWLATAVVCTFLVAAKGAENVMWAFQLGFVGALLLGLGALHLANHGGRSPRRELLASATAVASLTFSGVAVPMVATVGAVTWMRRGWRPALRLLAPCLAAYLIWLALVGHRGLGTHPVTLGGLLGVPEYTWRGLVATVQGYTVLGEGAPVFLLALAYALLRRRGWTRTAAAAAPAGALGAVMLYLTVGPGRIAQGVEQAQQSRYLYLAWALLLPAVATVLHEVVRGHGVRQAAVVVLVLACTVAGLDSLRSYAEREEQNEQSLKGVILASADLAASGAPVFPLAPHVFASDLNPSSLARLRRQGAFERSGPARVSDRLSAAAALQVRLPPLSLLPSVPGAVVVRDTARATVTPGTGGCSVIAPAGGRPAVSLAVTAPAGLKVTAVRGGELRILVGDDNSGFTLDPGRTVALAPGTPASIDLAITAATPVLLLPEAGETTLCGAASPS